jgi:hypothetical protein
MLAFASSAQENAGSQANIKAQAEGDRRRRPSAARRRHEGGTSRVRNWHASSVVRHPHAQRRRRGAISLKIAVVFEIIAELAHEIDCFGRNLVKTIEPDKRILTMCYGVASF